MRRGEAAQPLEAGVEAEVAQPLEAEVAPGYVLIHSFLHTADLF